MHLLILLIYIYINLIYSRKWAYFQSIWSWKFLVMKPLFYRNRKEYNIRPFNIEKSYSIPSCFYIFKITVQNPQYLRRIWNETEKSQVQQKHEKNKKAVRERKDNVMWVWLYSTLN